MAEERVDRRLAAIFAADIAGYSRLMGANEEGTFRQLKAHRKELVDPKITEHRGRTISGDPEQEYFADGISEDVITGLSKLRWFFVIARNSSFAYKGKAVDVKRAARELGVRYVLEGSVRKGGNRVRIATQLIDAATGNHIWADR
jgi:adenylate cyclase